MRLVYGSIAERELPVHCFFPPLRSTILLTTTAESEIVLVKEKLSYIGLDYDTELTEAPEVTTRRRRMKYLIQPYRWGTGHLKRQVKHLPLEL